MYPFIFSIDSYLLFMILGYVISFLGILLVNRKHEGYHLPAREITFLSIFVIFGVLLGARLLFALTMTSEIHDFHDFIDIMIDEGGFVFYGGVIGGVLTGLIYCVAYKLKPAKYADLIICFLPLGHAFGRIGCFLAGCCYGRQTESWLGIVFPADSVPALALNGGRPVKLYPVQLFESIFLFLLFAGLLIYFLRKKVHRPLFITGVYLLSYGIWRFLIEFLRGDEIRGRIILSTSQWISIFVVIIGVIIVFIIPNRSKFTKNKGEKNG